ncbi:MAG TPA: fibronectin type III domain-containing protein [Candidatus Acidoferrales bacterium]|nr:fibronectin type III domain-containing protein [Candidatus Acidoferrales bacterium]
MIRYAAPFTLACFFLACSMVAGCATPGDPTTRRPVIPVAVADLAAHQYGNAVSLTFTLPTRSTSREALADQPAIDVYRAALPPGATPGKETVWRLVYTIPSEQVDAYLKGQAIEFRDPLTPDDFARPAGSSSAYKVRTREEKTRASLDSNVVTTHLYPAPEAPHDVRVSVSESALTVNWAETAPVPGASAHSYHVYRAEMEPGQEAAPLDIATAKLKKPLELAGPSTSTEFQDTHFEFGMSYVYTVRSVAQYGEDFAESADSAPVYVTPRDIFPPAAPAELEIAVIPATTEGPAYIELSWAISPEADLAGYFVYRSDREDTDGERMNSEILLSPTFRDISVLPGKRYYYRVSAVDRAGNESPKSPAVQADVP